MSYTEDIALAWKRFLILLPVGVVPLIGASQGSLTPRQQRQIAWAFIAGCLLSISLCLSYALWQDLQEGFSTRHYHYANLTQYWSFHPHYLSFFLMQAITLLGWMWWEDFRASNKKPSWLLLGLIGFLTLFMVILAARMVLLLFAGFSVGALLYLSYRIGQWKKGLLAVLLLGSLVTSFLLLNDTTRNRLARLWESQSLMREPSNQWDGGTVRLFVWQYSWQKIQDEMPWGVGSGDVKQGLVDAYTEAGFTYGVERTLNSHNQYLETSLGLGIGGILYLLGLIGYGVWWGIKNHKPLFVLFWSLFFLACISEVMLNRVWGTYGLAYFTAFLAYSLSDRSVQSSYRAPDSEKESAPG